MTDVYPAGEKPIEGATGEELADAIRAHGHHAVSFVRDKKQVASALADVVEPGDLVIALGAGDINASARELLAILSPGAPHDPRQPPRPRGFPAGHRDPSGDAEIRGRRAALARRRPPRGPRGRRAFSAALRTLAGVVLVAGTSVGVAWVARRHVMTSPRFAIAEIAVSGNDHRPSDAIVAESGLQIGANVFVADLDAAHARILADPWIAEAALARRLPGTIVVHVTERKAAALAALGDTFLTTAEGEPFKKLEAGDPPEEIATLPLVTGLRARGDGR